MAFVPINYDSGKLCTVRAATGQTFAKGDAIVFTSGYAVPAASSSALDITHVAMQDLVTTADNQELLAIRTQGVVFEADCDAAVSIVDRGTYADLASVSTVNPDASSNDLFFIEEYLEGPAETSTKVRGWFATGVANS